MSKRIIVSFLVILVIGFTFVSCDSDKGKAVPIETFSAKETPLTLENYGSSDMKVTIQFSNLTANDSKLKYSIDGGEKQDVTLSASFDITVPAGGTISFYDDRPTTTKDSTIYTINCDKECYVYGNVMSLINSTDFKDLTSLKNHASAFAKLFFNNTNIIDHPKKALVLPATKLAASCYVSMFEGCTGLTKAPELPAKELAAGCYSSMFAGCSGLKEAPELPAKELAAGCYSSMFFGCSGLTAAPKLPAENLEGSCYYLMFRKCTNLKKAPELPADILATRCYEGMFWDCTGLTTAPELPATTLAQRCYYSMFQGCTGLTTAPALSATTLAKHCYFGMFQGCTGLTTAPALPATTLAERCYYGMFQGCTGLTEAPVLKAEELVPSCYSLMFTGCKNINKVTCHATSIAAGASFLTTNWLSGVHSSGTFFRPAAATFWESDSPNGIPAGWTTEDL